MKIIENHSNDSVLSELGERVARHRLSKNLTQADLAEAAGVSKRTLERIEAGNSAQLSSLFNILRALDLLCNTDRLIPEPMPDGVRRLEMPDKERKRASRHSTSNQSNARMLGDRE